MHAGTMQRQILFKCPRTRMNVQLSLDDEALECRKPEDTYISVPCPACMTLHFVNSTTGKDAGRSRRDAPLIPAQNATDLSLLRVNAAVRRRLASVLAAQPRQSVDRRETGGTPSACSSRHRQVFGLGCGVGETWGAVG